MTKKNSRTIEYWPLDSLVSDDANPKAHDEVTVRASFARFGVVDPIVVDGRTGRIVSGHGRRKALAAMAEAGEAPPQGVTVEDGQWRVPVTAGWSSKDDAEARAALVALNRTSETGGWDNGALLDLLDELGEESLDGVGFDGDDIDDLRVSLEGLAEDPGLDNTRETKSLSDYAERYDEEGRRLIVLDFSDGEYAVVNARLEAARQAYGVESNSDAVAAWLTRDYRNVTVGGR